MRRNPSLRLYTPGGILDSQTTESQFEKRTLQDPGATSVTLDVSPVASPVAPAGALVAYDIESRPRERQHQAVFRKTTSPEQVRLWGKNTPSSSPGPESAGTRARPDRHATGSGEAPGGHPATSECPHIRASDGALRCHPHAGSYRGVSGPDGDPTKTFKEAPCPRARAGTCQSKW
ncbi:hypothetical protein OH77DRAFT_141370 [Trametes cingulata]|nr:hypothetical protein OH77DRAFT_141370 [Trametes cingulata]